MTNKYEKQDNHKTDKWGNIISKEKNKKKEMPLNNPFKDIFCDFFLKKIKEKK